MPAGRMDAWSTPQLREDGNPSRYTLYTGAENQHRVIAASWQQRPFLIALIDSEVDCVPYAQRTATLLFPPGQGLLHLASGTGEMKPGPLPRGQGPHYSHHLSTKPERLCFRPHATVCPTLLDMA